MPLVRLFRGALNQFFLVQSFCPKLLASLLPVFALTLTERTCGSAKLLASAFDLEEFPALSVDTYAHVASIEEFSSENCVQQWPNPVFDSALNRLLSFILDGKMFLDPVLPSMSTMEPRAFLGVIGLEICALNFVAFHEFGHLLLGHLGRSRSPSLEHEADVFALQLIGKSGFPHREHAIVAVFAIVNVLELAFGLGASHPSSWQRLTVLANAEGVGLEFGYFEYSVNFYRELFDGALRVRFGRGLFEDGERRAR